MSFPEEIYTSVVKYMQTLGATLDVFLNQDIAHEIGPRIGTVLGPY